MKARENLTKKQQRLLGDWLISHLENVKKHSTLAALAVTIGQDLGFYVPKGQLRGWMQAVNIEWKRGGFTRNGGHRNSSCQILARAILDLVAGNTIDVERIRAIAQKQASTRADGGLFDA
jgi:hypothetical protein